MAARLRTLPLAFSSTIVGSFTAFSDGKFSFHVLVLTVVTTLLLQILSNFANDYGDYTKGTDNGNRKGPKRTVQSGLIQPRQMLMAIVIVSVLAFLSGSMLIFIGLQGTGFYTKLLFLIIGIVAIAAAVKYTIGKKPYGYVGLGDISVFLFFGLIGVVGTFYLHTHLFKLDLLLPATAIGLLSAGVLNLNNMRDIDNDRRSMKYTLAVIWGAQIARFYHLALVIGAYVAVSIYFLINDYSVYSYIYLVLVPFFIQHLGIVFKNKQAESLDSELKRLSLLTLVFSVLFSIGIVI